MMGVSLVAAGLEESELAPNPGQGAMKTGRAAMLMSGKAGLMAPMAKVRG
jgi:hypothetical protein